MKSVRFPRPAAVPVYLIVSGIGSAAFSMYAFIASVYRIVEVGLDPLELVLVGTVLELTVFFFEVPTGVVADVYGRRFSLVISSVLVGAAFVLEGLVPMFLAVLLAQVIFGVGATFRSGALQAWIADELDNEGVGRAYLRGSQASRTGSIVGIGLGVAVSSGYGGLPVSELAAPLVLGGFVTLLLGLFMAVAMPEDGFRPVSGSERGSWRTMAATFVRATQLARRRPELLAILAIALFYGAFSEPLDRFWELHILEVSNFALPAQAVLGPAAWWGFISIATRLLGIAGAELVARSVDIDAPRAALRALSIINALSIAGVVAFALSGNFAAALAAYLVYKAVRSTGGPFMSTWTNQQLESDVRATVFSMSAQFDAFGQVASGPVMGVVATRTAVRVALLATAALLAPPQAILASVALMRKRPGTDSADGRG